MFFENAASLADVIRLSEKIETDVSNGVISLSVPVSRNSDERIERLQGQCRRRKSARRSNGR